jgi:hypothetical protein
MEILEDQLKKVFFQIEKVLLQLERYFFHMEKVLLQVGEGALQMIGEPERVGRVPLPLKRGRPFG